MPQQQPSQHKSIGVAVLGFGLAGRVFHCPFISAVPGLELRTVLQRSGDTAREAYSQVAIARTLDEVLANEQIELVVVATPNDTHLPFAAAALRAGKHVVIDKPIAPSAEGVATLMSLARERSLLLAPFHNRRWDGDYLTVRQLLGEGRLGRLVSFSSRFDRFRPVPRTGTWKEAEGDAHGLLLDLGPHLVDQVLTLFGLPSTLQASVRREREGTTVDDAFDLTLTFPNGPRVTLGSTLIAAEPSPRYLLQGTSGSYKKFGVDPQEPTLVAGGRVPALGSGDWLAEDPSAYGTLTLCANPAAKPSELTSEPLQTLPGDYRSFYKNVLDALRGKAPLAVTAADAWTTLHLLELARRSSEGGCALPVEAVPPPASPSQISPR